MNNVILYDTIMPCKSLQSRSFGSGDELSHPFAVQSAAQLPMTSPATKILLWAHTQGRLWVFGSVGQGCSEDFTGASVWGWVQAEAAFLVSVSLEYTNTWDVPERNIIIVTWQKDCSQESKFHFYSCSCDISFNKFGVDRRGSNSASFWLCKTAVKWEDFCCQNLQIAVAQCCLELPIRFLAWLQDLLPHQEQSSSSTNSVQPFQ